MSSTQHTQGRIHWWDESSGRPEQYDLAKLLSESGEHILSCYGGAGDKALGKLPRNIANARRLVACWNACLTLPTEIIEQGLVESLMRAKEIGQDEATHALAKRIQTLVDALAATETYLLERVSSKAGSTGATVILPMIRRAIEGAEVAPTQSTWADC